MPSLLEDNILTGNCFGCGEGGDVISFVMKIDGMGFTEVVERLADKYGVTLRREEGDDRAQRPKGPQRQRLIEAHRLAQELYADALGLARGAGRPARSWGSAASTRPPPSSSAWGSPPVTASRCCATCGRRGSATRRRSPPAWSRSAGRRTTASGGACSGRSATPAATRSGSAPGGSSTTTGSRRSTSTRPRRRSTRRARCSTASTWRAARSPARCRRWWSRATPT